MIACVLKQEDYKPGDQAPDGYLAWHEWAEVQHKVRHHIKLMPNVKLLGTKVAGGCDQKLWGYVSAS